MKKTTGNEKNSETDDELGQLMRIERGQPTNNEGHWTKDKGKGLIVILVLSQNVMLMGSSGLNWFDSQSCPIPVRGLWAAPNYPLNWTSPGCWLGVPSPLQVLGFLIVACVNSMPLQLIQKQTDSFLSVSSVCPSAVWHFSSHIC